MDLYSDKFFARFFRSDFFSENKSVCVSVPVLKVQLSILLGHNPGVIMDTQAWTMKARSSHAFASANSALPLSIRFSGSSDQPYRTTSDPAATLLLQKSLGHRDSRDIAPLLYSARRPGVGPTTAPGRCARHHVARHRSTTLDTPHAQG